MGQLTITGNVFDSSRTIPVPNVLVKSSGGTQAITDSTGHYEIVTTDKDSLSFIYNNKSNHFDTPKTSCRSCHYAGVRS